MQAQNSVHTPRTSLRARDQLRQANYSLLCFNLKGFRTRTEKNVCVITGKISTTEFIHRNWFNPLPLTS